ncbi:TetR/AcrR family transcriptional regulator [Actinomadura rubrisoli]|uniref:TetR/AcrR family transcriptional regulator n=1 Tax=Actinomadura rubrisoli TaxID=2530368 RepID=A0A4R5C9W4_9ACTN|nr:helix-turn-helix domain-containing protein [Actinomadura rubrisoli]TDD95466.1 TetR/AcrR family transcriptional regulator [Actinomadura rubrisoli]
MTAALEPMRDRILAAAIEVIRGRGIVAATTKEIARRAGVSEGSLYNHFANKTALFAAALGEVTGTARAAMAALGASAGQGTVEGNLVRLAADMVRFYGELLPMTGPVLADPELIAWLRADGPAKAQEAVGAKPAGRSQSGHDGGARPSGSADGLPSAPGGPPTGPPGGATAGPVLGHAALIGYLEAERRAGRLADGAPLPFIAAALLGGCHQHAFLTRLAGPEAVAAGARLPEEPEEFAERLVRTILAGHLPA